MKTIKMPVRHNEHTNTTYFQKFIVQNNLPEVGIDEWKGIEILSIEEANLDFYVGRYEEIMEYDFYEVKSRILPIDDEEDDDVYYDYIAIPKSEESECEEE